MVDIDEFKRNIEGTFPQKEKVEFLGKNFEDIVKSITEQRAEKIYKWASQVVQKQIQPIAISSNKSYKEWEVNQLLVFRYPMNIGGNEYRLLLVKVKNSFYIEFHIGDHNYYDKVRKNLDLKKTSY